MPSSYTDTSSTANAPDADDHWMRHAIALAQRGQGCVEPNPMVGCVIVRHGEVLGQGYHMRYGGKHAEIEAIDACGAAELSGSTFYVTLEPCTHHGKTPPCLDRVLAAAPRRVVIGLADPFPAVAGRGIAALQAAGVDVCVGVQSNACRALLAPYLKRQLHQRPWVIAKWAMTLDGRLATASGESQWITGDRARAHAHAVRGRVDAIAVGIGTALADDPQLTARPSSVRLATRIVFDRQGRLPVSSRLIATIDQAPVLVVVGPHADASRVEALRRCGVEVLATDSDDETVAFDTVFRELAIRGMTNVLVDGGPRLQGSLIDAGQVDEIHSYIGAQLFGGPATHAPNLGRGIQAIAAAQRFAIQHSEIVGEDLFLSAIHHRVLAEST